MIGNIAKKVLGAGVLLSLIPLWNASLIAPISIMSFWEVFWITFLCEVVLFVSAFIFIKFIIWCFK